jgi:hypothetical protein
VIAVGSESADNVRNIKVRININGNGIGSCASRGTREGVLFTMPLAPGV